MAGSIRPRLASAIAKLKETGAYDEAAAVEAVTGPRGYLLLRRTETGSTVPLSITVSEMLKAAINETAEAWDLVLDGLAEEAYRKVRDERWIPAEVGKAGSGRGGKKAVLQVSVDTELRQAVQEMLPALSNEAGYRVTEGNIVLTHICEELGIERPNTAVAEKLATRIPRALFDHFHAESERLGVPLREATEDGITRLLDGSWTPERHPYLTTDKRGARESSWSESDRAYLNVRVDRELLAEMRLQMDELSERLGYLVEPGSVLRAILTDRFGEPAE